MCVCVCVCVTIHVGRFCVCSVLIFGKNSTNIGADISHSGPIPSEGRGIC